MSEDEQEQVAPIQTVRMVRLDDGKTGDIHPDEVEHMQAFGWRICEDQTGTGDADDLSSKSDDELRAAVTEATGTAPHPNAKRETLIKKLQEAQKGE
ncbi:hypothetical protein [Gellertiella hungarica]|uniref:Uncharacterized protein n=1 Tax=Gellertiella hungarica TaxID=1572859 RepID=A0A7W6J426_9HYPH|nr:hypothetical protein [Gellertiella hungarica]MBB4063677.1 hypothetical protein [Gellertiella hungarica]